MSWARSGRSLTRSILLGTGFVTLAGLLCAAAALYVLYVGTDSRVREATLQGEARRVTAYLRDMPTGGPVALPPALVHTDIAEPVWCVVVDAAGRVVAALDGAAGPLFPPGEARAQFRRHDPGTGQLTYGLSERVELPGGPAWVQIATPADSDMLFDSLLEEFVGDFGWLLLPFGIAVLVTNALLIQRDLRPLRAVSAGAAAIGPGRPGVRLPEAEVPGEVLPLVRAMNGALDRLEEGAARQRRFIADVAHELRTPLAVLRLQLDRLGDAGAAAAMRRDLAGMERMVGQLLDLARLEGLAALPAEEVDLNRLGAEVVRYLGPLAIAGGRGLALAPAARPVLVQGCPDALFRAVRNLAENALQHAPEGSEVEVQVAEGPAILVRDYGPGIPDAARSRIFDRLWQGQRDRAGGAGLGLAIVAGTAAAHGARVTVEAPPAGGTLIGLRFHAAHEPARLPESSVAV